MGGGGGGGGGGGEGKGGGGQREGETDYSVWVLAFVISDHNTEAGWANTDAVGYSSVVDQRAEKKKRVRGTERERERGRRLQHL